VIASTAAHRQAAGLVDIATEGKLDQHTRGLIEVARTNPVRAAELIRILADSVAALSPVRPDIRITPPDAALSAPNLLAYLRRAHAAYSRGMRLPWAIEGEREYQRLKKRHLRARNRARTNLRAAS